MSLASPLRTVSSCSISLWVSLMQDPHLSKLDVLGAHLSSAVLKRWGATCRVQTLHTSGNRVVSSLLIVGAVLGIRFMVRSCLSLSNSFNVVCVCFPHSFIQYVGVCQVVFEFLSEESVSYVAVDLVSVGRGEFRILLHHHLDPELGKLMFNVIKIQSSYQSDL